MTSHDRRLEGGRSVAGARAAGAGGAQRPGEFGRVVDAASPPLEMATLASRGRAIVVFVAAHRKAFAVQAEDGRCAVFCQHAGPHVHAGDVLEGPVLSRGSRILQHPEGACAVVGDSGPVSRARAHVLLYG